MLWKWTLQFNCRVTSKTDLMEPKHHALNNVRTFQIIKYALKLQVDEENFLMMTQRKTTKRKLSSWTLLRLEQCNHQCQFLVLYWYVWIRRKSKETNRIKLENILQGDESWQKSLVYAVESWFGKADFYHNFCWC